MFSLCVAQAQSPAPPLPAIYALTFSPDGKTLAVGTHKQALLYDAATWTVSKRLTRQGDAVRSFAFHPDGKRLALGGGVTGATGSLALWDTATPDQMVNYGKATDTIEGIAFNKDGSSMLTASFDSKARFYRNAYYAFGNQPLEEHNGRVTSVAFSPKPNTIFITGAMDKMVKVWEFESVKVVVNFDQATAGITGLEFLNNGDQFVGSSMDGNLYWWGVGYNERKKIYSGYSFRKIKAHEDGVTAFSISSNRQRIATGGMDKTVKVWNMENGGQVCVFKEPSAPIYATALTPDGKICAAAGREGVIWIWDVEANKLITTITPPRVGQKIVASALASTTPATTNATAKTKP